MERAVKGLDHGWWAYAASSLLHGALILAMAHNATNPSAPEELPKSTPPETPPSATAPQRLISLLPEPEAQPEPVAPPAPLALAHLPALAIPPLSQDSRDPASRREGESRGGAADALGIALQLATTQALAEEGSKLGERYRTQAALSDRERDRRLQEWQRTSDQYQGVNLLRRRWRELWQPRYGHLVGHCRLTVDLDIASDGTVHYLGIAPGGGTGLDELDAVIDACLRALGPSTVQPTKLIQGRVTCHLVLD